MSRPVYQKLVQHRAQILALATRYGARNVRVFGSVARREADEESDLDVLVAMEPGRTLLDVAGLLVDLQDLLGCPVDIVTEGGLRGNFREQVLAEAISIEEMAA